MTSHVTPHHPTALFESFSSGPHARSFRFEGLETVVAAYSYDKVVPALAEIEQAVDKGKHAAGFVSYGAAAAINPELPAMAPDKLPLLWFGIFTERLACEAGFAENATEECQVSASKLDIDKGTYTTTIEKIRTAIAAGETYQVNFTARQRFNVNGDPFALYRRMCRNQQAPFCAWLDTGTHLVLSASPELFFSLENDLLTMRPMKGTACRMPRADDDLRQRDLLRQNPKERAENLMIVDLVRNDLSTIAETGSVEVRSLFDIETFPTVHQMTSTVTARIRPDAGLAGIFRALFPCGSVTGAPKRRTMEIIGALESSPRGLYCGAIGYISPGRDAVFSVAIRTAVVEASSGNGEIGVGSGITWDSDAGSEFQECLAKSAFMGRDSTPFQLVETLRFDRNGYLLLDRHLERLAGSAAYFGFKFDSGTLRERLHRFGEGLNGIHKVRVLLAADGGLTLEDKPIGGLSPPPLEGRGGDGVDSEISASCTYESHPPPNLPLEGGGTKGEPAEQITLIAVAKQRVTSSDPFLHHKTTRRALYDREHRACPDCYDVIFLNERDEVTEGSFNNIVVSLHGELLTPSLDCGLLPGVLRAELIETGAVREAVLTLDNLCRADRIWLVNSVRGWRECRLQAAKTD